MKIFTVTKSGTGGIGFNKRLRLCLNKRLFRPQAEGTLGDWGREFVSCIVADLIFMQIVLITFKGPNYEVGQCEYDKPYRRLHRGIDQAAASETWLLQIENYFPQGG